MVRPRIITLFSIGWGENVHMKCIICSSGGIKSALKEKSISMWFKLNTIDSNKLWFESCVSHDSTKTWQDWRKLHDFTRVKVVIQLRVCIIRIMCKLWFDSQAHTTFCFSLFSWFASRDCVIQITHPKP